MDRPDTSVNDALLDLYFGRLEPWEAERIRAEIQSNEQLAARSRRLNGWLGLLQAYESPPPPAGLIDSVMKRVGESPSLRPAAADSSLPPAVDGGTVRRPVFSLRELVALAACLTFLVSVVVPGFSRMRSVSRRNLCASNMSGVFQGLGQYAHDFNGSLPQSAGFVPGINWLRSPAPSIPRMTNSRNLYLVVRLGHAKADTFICPSAGVRSRIATPQPSTLDDFPTPNHCGFSFQNMAGPTLPLHRGGGLPILADHNPLFDNDQEKQPTSLDINSRSHDAGSGQNVLTSDGRVLWVTSPRLAPSGDNIWQIEGIEHYSGTEIQQRPDDVFMVR